MQVLPQALYLVLLELTAGAFLSLYLLDIRGGVSQGFVRFQGLLYLILGILTLLAFDNFASPAVVKGSGLDEAWVAAQPTALVIFLLLMVPWNVTLWRTRGNSSKADKQPEPGATIEEPTRRYTARMVTGLLASVAGVAAVIIAGIAYHTLAAAHLGGTFVVLTFLAGAIALGGVTTAMLLGHWYLNTPTASGKPLEFVTLLMLVALAGELLFALLMGPSTAKPTQRFQPVTPGTTIQTTGGGLVIVTPTVSPSSGQQVTATEKRIAPLGQNAMIWLQFLMGFGAPLILGGIALYLCKSRSFQSATGMLYLCVAFIFIGEVLGRGLLLLPISGF